MKSYRRVAEHKRCGARGGRANTVSDTSRLGLGVHDRRCRQFSVVYEQGPRLRRQKRGWFFLGIFFCREYTRPVPFHQKYPIRLLREIARTRVTIQRIELAPIRHKEAHRRVVRSVHSAIRCKFQSLTLFGQSLTQREKSAVGLAGVIAPEQLQLLMHKVHSTNGDSTVVQCITCAIDCLCSAYGQKQCQQKSDVTIEPPHHDLGASPNK